MKIEQTEITNVCTNQPNNKYPPSFPFRFGVTTLLYILLVLFPMKYGFGLDVVNVAGVIIPTVIFGLIFSRGITK